MQDHSDVQLVSFFEDIFEDHATKKTNRYMNHTYTDSYNA